MGDWDHIKQRRKRKRFWKRFSNRKPRKHRWRPRNGEKPRPRLRLHSRRRKRNGRKRRKLLQERKLLQRQRKIKVSGDCCRFNHLNVLRVIIMYMYYIQCKK